MTAAFYVRVPRVLAARLADDGFSVAGGERGLETLAAESANLVTVLVGAHEISLFVRHLWVLRRRGKTSPESESESKVIIERDGRRVAITLAHEGFGDDDPPQAVVDGMTALFAELSRPEWRHPDV